MEKQSPETQLNAKQLLVLDALPTSKTITEAAEKAGVGARLIRRWLEHDTGFQQKVKIARRHALAEATARLQQLSRAAVGALDDLIEGENVTAASRVSAIRIALDFAYRGAELEQLEEIEERLRRVEATLDELPADVPAAEVHWIEKGKTTVVRPK